jgi:hypothetical protein
LVLSHYPWGRQEARSFFSMRRAFFEGTLNLKLLKITLKKSKSDIGSPCFSTQKVDI